MMELTLFLICIVMIYGYTFLSGFTDAANAIATSIGTGALSPRVAVVMAGILELVGALTGTAVALTIGKGIVDPGAVSLVTVAGALIGASAWSLLTYKWSIPVSETHGLIGGIIGAALATTFNLSVVNWTGLSKVFIAIVASPLFGFWGAMLAMKLLYLLCYRLPAAPAYFVFTNLQRLSAAFMAFSHGRNDAQKPMGILVLALAIHYGWNMKEVTVPVWVILSIGTIAGIGVAAGGWRIIRTLGMRVSPLRVEQGFIAETSAAGILQIASSFGIPVSTTHTITSAIVGVGSARRVSLVRWDIVRNIVVSWVLTLPVTVVLAAAATLILESIF